MGRWADGQVGTDTSANLEAASTPAATHQAVPASFGPHLPAWRMRRHLSQKELACTADLTTRQLSVLETGRAHPSRDMLLRLAARQRVPLRERNPMLARQALPPCTAPEHWTTLQWQLPNNPWRCC